MIELKMLSLGSDMGEGRLLSWQVAPGDAVRKGQVVAVVDTAKAAIDVECWHDGTVHADAEAARLDTLDKLVNYFEARRVP